ncbi:MAG: AAA family ATPase, partial [Planctomycetota bacterium]|nr:AAA family ATPase [Planctomycetota bacterium]
YSLDELAALAGVAPADVLAWEAKGWLGEVARAPSNGRDEAGAPLYAFAQAERCVQLGGRGGSRRICVVNQKGGVGKTTTAFTLAAAFADLGRRVLAVDLDAQANLTTSFGFDPDELDLTSADLLTEEGIGPEDVILETAIEGVHAIPGDIKLCAVETRIQDVMMREWILRTKLEPLFDRYHVIIFDCPPNLSRITINALTASQEVVVPIETQSYSIKAISDLNNTFTLLKQRMRHDLRVWILPTKVDRRMKLAGDILDALDAGFRGQILDPIHVDSNLIRAPLLCQPVTQAFPTSRASVEYARLARFLVLPDAERKQWMDLPLATRREVIARAERGEEDLGLPTAEDDSDAGSQSPAPKGKRAGLASPS